MKTEVLDVIEALRSHNYSYSFIANELEMPMNTVKSICRRKGFKAFGKRKTKAEKMAAALCKSCHRPLASNKRSDSKFCSAKCCMRWHRQNKKVIKKQS